MYSDKSLYLAGFEPRSLAGKAKLQGFNQNLLDGDHLSRNQLIKSSILLFNQHDSNPVEEETMMTVVLQTLKFVSTS